MKLVSDYKRVWRYYSTQALLLLAAAPLIWAEMPPDVRDMVPEGWRPWLLAGMAASGVVGRYISQRPAP